MCDTPYMMPHVDHPDAGTAQICAALFDLKYYIEKWPDKKKLVTRIHIYDVTKKAATYIALVWLCEKKIIW